MAHDSNLPCDGDGICMICRKKPSDSDIVTCKTCVTPWHADCLFSRPQTLADGLKWECPDCSPVADANPVTGASTGKVALAGGSETSGDLIATIRAIESDQSLTDQQKAKRRQELLSNTARSANVDDANQKKEKKSRENEVLDLLDGGFNCSFCMQLPERPVTTPCGHNFCLKCFQKWIGQGKRSCANCRHPIPPKMASQPRINSALVIAIRMAKMSKPITGGDVPKVYHVVHNENRPDKAYTTERAKKSGKANACSGKIFVTIPSDHLGPILAEHDPERNQGVLVGETWEDRMECRQWGAHFPHVAGIAGQSDYGAQSVALSGGYVDDEDHGEWFLYTGSGGRDLSGNKRTNKDQSFDQKFDKSNEALRVSCRSGYPVRVVRSHKEKRSSYAPETGVRYDGIYRIEKCWRKVGIQGFKVCRYLFVRCDNEPAPWTSDDHGDRPRPLPVIKELKNATDVTERKGTPSWDFDEEKGCWMWKRSPPDTRKAYVSVRKESQDGEGVTYEERTIVRKTVKKSKNLSVKAKLLKEFSCLICKKVMVSPLTTPCAHNFCKSCLEGAFSGQSFIRQRTCEGRRTLRQQKNVMKCPSCTNDISDFLQNPQVNRELMNVIETLQRDIADAEAEAAAEAEEHAVAEVEAKAEVEEHAEVLSEETGGTDENASDEVTVTVTVTPVVVDSKTKSVEEVKKPIPNSPNGTKTMKSNKPKDTETVAVVEAATLTPTRSSKRNKANSGSCSAVMECGVQTPNKKAKVTVA